MKILYVTDVHGGRETYEGLFELAEKKDIKAVFIGGDICPGFNSLMQREFLKKYLIPRARKFRKKAGKPVFIIMGNDDLAANRDLFEEAEKEGLWNYVHMKAARLGRFTVIGYTCINPTPFMLKDWEREEEELGNDMKRLAKMAEGKRVIILFHTPPFGTSLDVLHDGSHVGSIAIAEFIKKRSPAVTFHGHIHESPAMTGVIAERIGRTLAINPGSRNIIAIDIEKLDEIEILM